MILYFSGTGNSRYVAKRLGEALQDEVVSMNGCLRSGERGAFQSETPYVIVTPTYAWRMPRVVRAFLEQAALTGSRDTYFVLTCGGAVGNAAADAAQLCAEKGLRFCGLQPVVMPDNYLVMFPVPAPDEAARIVRAAAPAIRQAADCIRAREPFPARRAGLGGRLLSALVNPLFYLQPQRDRAFTVSDACIGCGRCAALCPLGNIRLEQGRPVYGGNCTHCMACISACPVRAIEYGRATRGRQRHYLEDGGPAGEA